jgi:hypothetical protein
MRYQSRSAAGGASQGYFKLLAGVGYPRSAEDTHVWRVVREKPTNVGHHTGVRWTVGVMRANVLSPCRAAEKSIAL